MTNLQQLITNYLIENSDKYTEWHGQNADKLVYESTEFFTDRNFNQDVVDIIVQATGDALNVKLKVFRRSPAGNIQLSEVGDLTSQRVLHLKLSCSEKSQLNPEYTGDNHYDALTVLYKNINTKLEPESNKDKDTEEPFVDLTLISPVKQKQMSCEAFIDLTESPMKVPLSLSDTDKPDSLTTDEDSSLSWRSDFTERLQYMSDTLSQFEDDEEERSDVEGLQCRSDFVLDLENVDEIIEQYLRPATMFPIFLFKRVTPKKVEFLPHNIDGNVYYKVCCTIKNYAKKTTNRRWFAMRTSSKRGLKGVRKVGTCKGSWKCINGTCSFLKTEHKENHWHFEYRGGSKACYSCGHYAAQEPCGARKLVQMAVGAEYAQVFHIGKHTCTLQQEVASDIDYTCKWVERYPGLTYRDLKSQVIQHHLDSGDSKEAESAVYRITSQAFRKLKRDKKAEQNPDQVETQSLEAVAELKKGSDTIDPFHIYRINSKKMNNLPDFVMKSSSKILQLAIDMDIDGPENPLQLEDAYFDGSHSRCTDFVSLGLWVMHAPMRQMIRLASMEVRTEHTDELTIFWKLLNEMLAKLTKKPDYKFNPNYILFDEAGANFTSVKGIFSDEFVKKRVVTCQWHFLNKVMDSINKIGEDYQEEFAEKAGQLCKVPTVPEFELLFARLKEICAMFPETGNFLNWYYARRTHLFPAFRAGRHSGVNLAEVGNAMWKPQRKLSLVAAAKDDIATMMQQESDVVRFKGGEGFKRGYASTDTQRATMEKRTQMEQARSFAQVLQNEAALQMQREADENPPYFMPSSSSSHKPTKKTKTLEGRAMRGTGRGRGKGRGQGKSAPTPTLNELLEKLNRAKRIESGEEVPDVPGEEPEVESGMPVLGSGPEPRKVRPIKSTEAFPNPPYVVHSLYNLSKCQGCPEKIDPKKKPPHDIFFRMKAIRPYQVKETLMWHDKVANAYFHLKLECLKKFDPTINVEDITMTNEMFKNISDVYLAHLAQLGILKHIIGNKGKEIGVSTTN